MQLASPCWNIYQLPEGYITKGEPSELCLTKPRKDPLDISLSWHFSVLMLALQGETARALVVFFGQKMGGISWGFQGKFMEIMFGRYDIYVCFNGGTVFK